MDKLLAVQPYGPESESGASVYKVGMAVHISNPGTRGIDRGRHRLIPGAC